MYTAVYRHGRRQQGGRASPCIFTRGTNIVNGGLIVLFFSLFLLFFGVFSVALPPHPRKKLGLFHCFPPLEIFLPTLLCIGHQPLNYSHSTIYRCIVCIDKLCTRNKMCLIIQAFITYRINKPNKTQETSRSVSK